MLKTLAKKWHGNTGFVTNYCAIGADFGQVETPAIRVVAGACPGHLACSCSVA